MDKFLRSIQWIALMLFGLCELVFASSSTKAILVGTDLTLTCNNTNNSQWWFDGKSLHGNTQLVNNTLTLKINNVNINNQGTYWCGTSWKKGYNVSVIIGSCPSKPRSVLHRSYEWVDTLYWIASLHTGGLPVHYTVTAECPKLSANSSAANLKCQEKATQVLVTNKAHVADRKYSCSLGSVDLFTPYHVCVFAVNELGNSSVCFNFKRSSMADYTTSTTPAPPSQFKVIEFRPGEARLSWEKVDKDKYVLISYFKIGDNSNTTLKEYPADETAIIIPNLKANSWYKFYARSQYKLDGRKLSVLSSTKAATLHTKDTVPTKPPHNMTCDWFGGFSNGIGNISLSWEPPPKQSQNGKLTNYIVLVYSKGHQNFNKTVNASQNSALLQGLNRNDDVTLKMRACNERGCSGIGKECFVLADTLNQKNLPSSSNIRIIVSCVVGTVLLVVAAIVVWFICRRPKKPPHQEDPDWPVIDGPTYTEADYADVENIEIPGGYTQINDNPQAPLILVAT